MQDTNEYAETIKRKAAAELDLITTGRRPYLEPEQWKPVAHAATAPVSGVTLDGGPMRAAFERNIWYLNAWYARTDGGRSFRTTRTGGRLCCRRRAKAV